MAVTVLSEDPELDPEVYRDRIEALVITREGTLPGSRGFGLTGNFISKNPTKAANILAVELADKAALYLPEVEIRSVELADHDEENGSAEIRILIGRRA